MKPAAMGEQVLLVLDAQRAYTERESPLYCRDSRGTLERINRLVAAFQEQRKPVVYVRHEYESDLSDVGRMTDYDGGSDTPFRRGSGLTAYTPDLKRLRGAPQVVKNRYSAFAGTGLKHELDVADAGHVVIAGFMTNFCCESTARQAHDLDYRVTFLPDATGCPDLSDELDEPRIRAIVGAFLAAGFATVQDTEAFLAGFPTLEA